MAISTMDGLVSALASTNQNIPLWLVSATTVAGSYLNLNRANVNSFGQAAIPTVIGSGGHVPVDGATGYPVITAGGGGTSLYIARLEAWNTATTGTLAIYDRVWAASGFSGTVTTPQTITGPVALPSVRAPNSGDGLEIWLESYTAIGASASNVTVSYTNSAGTAGRTTVSDTITASFPANRMHRLRYQDGDTGIQSIQSLTLSGNTGTAGNFGITLLSRKCALPIPNITIGSVADFATLGMPVIQSDAALQFVYTATSTATGNIMGALNVISG
jgi:hypothetical protein